MILSIDYTQNTQIDQLGGDEFLIQFTGKIDTFQPGDTRPYHYLLFAVLNYDEDGDPPQTFDVKEVLKLNPYNTDTTSFIPLQAEDQTMRKSVGASRDTSFQRPVRPVYTDINSMGEEFSYFTTFTDQAGLGVDKTFSKYNQKDLITDCTNLLSYVLPDTLKTSVSNCNRLYPDKKNLINSKIDELVRLYPNFDLYKIRFYNVIEDFADVQIMAYDTDKQYYEVLYQWPYQNIRKQVYPTDVEAYTPKINRFFSFTRAGELGRSSYNVVPTLTDICDEIRNDREINYLLHPELRKNYFDSTCGKLYEEAVVYTVLQNEKVFSREYTQGTVAQNYSNIAANIKTRNGVIVKKENSKNITNKIAFSIISDEIVKNNFLKVLEEIFIKNTHYIHPDSMKVSSSYYTDYTSAVNSVEEAFNNKNVDILFQNQVVLNILNHEQLHPYKVFDSTGNQTGQEFRVYQYDGVKLIDVTEVVPGQEDYTFEYYRYKNIKVDQDYIINKAIYSQFNPGISSFEDNDYKVLAVDRTLDIGNDIIKNFVSDEFIACLIDNKMDFNSPSIYEKIKNLPKDVRNILKKLVLDGKETLNYLKSGGTEEGCTNCDSSSSSTNNKVCGINAITFLRANSAKKYYTMKKIGQTLSRSKVITFQINDIPRNFSWPHTRFYFNYKNEIKDVNKLVRVLTLLNYDLENDEVIAYYPNIIKFGKRTIDEMQKPITEDSPIEVIADIADGAFTKCMPTTTITAIDQGGNVFIPVFSLDDAQVIDTTLASPSDATSSDMTNFEKVNVNNTLYIINMKNADSFQIYYQLRMCSNLTVQEVDLSKSNKTEAFIPLYITDAALL